MILILFDPLEREGDCRGINGFSLKVGKKTEQRENGVKERGEAGALEASLT